MQPQNYTTDPAKSTYPKAVGDFFDAHPDAHLVRCGYKNNPKAAHPGWHTERPTLAAIVQHSKDHLVGLVPASVGYTVLDVDEGHPLDLALNLRPDYFTPSGTPGRGHLWFLDGESRPNSAWKLRGQSGKEWAGEIRSGNGYVVLWHPDTLAQGHMLHHGEVRARVFDEVTQWLKSTTSPAPAAPPSQPPLPDRKQSKAIERAIAIISAIPSGDYDTWVQVGQCLEGSARKGDLAPANAYQLWRNWSARAPDKYPGDDVLSRKWASFRGGNPRTLGTLVQQYGGR